MYNKSPMPAAEIMIDDRIKVGGSLYRIYFIANAPRFTQLLGRNTKDDSLTIDLVLPPETTLTIYNQK